MNDYIELDGKKYATNAKTWHPVRSNPATERRTLTGSLDITYGPGEIFSWEGEIHGPVIPRDGTWGSITDLRASIVKKSALTMRDHYGEVYNVYCLGDFPERSLMNVWDNPANVFYVFVRLVKS